MTERRCQECRSFYDKRLPECPHCGASRHEFNSALDSERFRNNLLAHAVHAKKYS